MASVWLVRFSSNEKRLFSISSMIFFGDSAVIECILNIITVTGTFGTVMDHDIDDHVLAILNFIFFNANKSTKS